jgi:hypothetical protein
MRLDPSQFNITLTDSKPPPQTNTMTLKFGCEDSTALVPIVFHGGAVFTAAFDHPHCRLMHD